MFWDTPEVVQDRAGSSPNPSHSQGGLGPSCPTLGLSFPICSGSDSTLYPFHPRFASPGNRHQGWLGGADIGTMGIQDRAILVEPASGNPRASLPTEDPWVAQDVVLHEWTSKVMA